MSNLIKSNDQIVSFGDGYMINEREVGEYPLMVGNFIYTTAYSRLEVYEVLGFVDKISELPEHYKNEPKRGIIVELKSIYGGGNGRKTLKEVEGSYNVCTKIDINLFNEIAEKVLSKEMTMGELNNVNDKDIPDTTQVATINNNDYYNQLMVDLKNNEAKIAIISKLVEKKVETMLDGVREMTSYLSKAIKKLNKIIITLRIYGGLEESVIQICEGKSALPSEPVYLQQNMLFMDEEVGDPTNGGISYDSVDMFYDWLREVNPHYGYENYKLILPHEKCVVIMRVRRDPSKKYLGDIFGNIFNIQRELKTCMLIRNGENVYVIHSEMDFSEKLFPSQSELEEALSAIDGKSGSYFDKEKAENKLEQYKNGIVLIQGIFDRTDLLAPMGSVKILNGEDLNNGKVIYNYPKLSIDDENNPTNKLNKWLCAKDVSEGDRILFIDFPYGDGVKHRVTKFYQSDYSVPIGPEVGIYTLEKYENRLSFLYLPEERYNSYKPRVKRERVIFNPNEDKFIKIDAFTHRDYQYINDLMYDRRYRRSYLWMHKLLNYLKEHIDNVRREEEPFSQLIIKQFPSLTMDEVFDYLFWWKFKNKWKRSLSTDDKKAYRMIIKKIKSDIGV